MLCSLDGARPIVGGKTGDHMVEEFCRSKVLPRSLAEPRLLESGLKRAYNDPSLRSFNKYASLVEHLFKRGMIQYSLSSVEQVGLFAVHKQGVSND